MEQRSLAADRQRGGDTRLHHAIAFHHPPGGGVETGAIERVGHLPDQAADGVGRHPIVGVEGEHIADASGNSGSSSADRQEGRIGGAAREPVQFMQLAALALPAQPSPLPLIPHPAAMEQHEPLSALPRLISAIEVRHPFADGGEQRFVALGPFGLGIDPIGEQSEIDLASRIGQMMDLNALDLLLDRVERAQQRRHGHDDPQRHGNAVLERQGRQQCRAEARQNGAIDQRHPQIEGGNRGEQGEQGDPGALQPVPGEQNTRQCQKQGSRRHDGGAIAADPQQMIETPQPKMGWRAKADGPLEGVPPSGQQMISGIGMPRGILDAQRPVHGLGCRDGTARYGDLVEVGVARQFLDRAAIEIAGGEIHRGEGAARGQYPIDEADAFDQLGPVHVGDQAHAGNDVADRDDRLRLALMLVAHLDVGRRSLQGQPFVQPGQGRCDARILIAQPIGQLDRESAG